MVVTLQPGEGTFCQGYRGKKPTGAEQKSGEASVWRHILPQSTLWGESLGNNSILGGGTHYFFTESYFIITSILSVFILGY